MFIGYIINSQISVNELQIHALEHNVHIYLKLGSRLNLECLLLVGNEYLSAAVYKNNLTYYLSKTIFISNKTLSSR